MKPSRRNWFVRLAVVGALVVTVAAWDAPAGAQTSPPVATVTIGVPSDGVFGLLGKYIIENGIDRKHGIQLEPKWAPVPEIERLLIIGAIQTGLAVKESAVRANLGGTPLRLLVPVMRPHQFVVVPVGSPYQRIEELRGKKIALTSEVTAMYNMFDFIMRERGVRIERDFQLIKTSGPAIMVHLEKKDVDAGLIWEPFVSRLLASGKYRTIMGLAEEMDKLTNSTERMAWVGAQEGWLEKNRETAARLRAVWMEAADRARTDEAFFRKVAKQFFGLEKPEELSLGWQRTPQSFYPKPWPDKSAIQSEIKRLERTRELGILPANAKVDIFWE